MSSVPDGRAANQPCSATTFTPPIAASLPGRLRQHRLDRLARELGGGDVLGLEREQLLLALGVDRRVRRACRPARRSARSARRRRRPGRAPVLAVISAASSASRMPSLSVDHGVPSRRRNDAPALSSPPKPSEPSIRPSTNHLKPTGTSTRRRPRSFADQVDHRARHERLADARVSRPVARAAEQVVDRDREVVVGVHQPGARRDDPVAVGVRVAGDGDVEAVAAARSARSSRTARSSPCGSCRRGRAGRSGRSGRPPR